MSQGTSSQSPVEAIKYTQCSKPYALLGASVLQPKKRHIHDSETMRRRHVPHNGNLLSFLLDRWEGKLKWCLGKNQGLS